VIKEGQCYSICGTDNGVNDGRSGNSVDNNGNYCSICIIKLRLPVAFPPSHITHFENLTLHVIYGIALWCFSSQEWSSAKAVVTFFFFFFFFKQMNMSKCKHEQYQHKASS
jgi:hypothetical protein